MHRPPEPRRRIPPDRPAARAPHDGPASSDASPADPAVAHARSLLGSLDLDPDLDLRVDHGVEGAVRATPTSPALEWARSGAMALTGDGAGAPRFAAGPLACAARGTAMALATLAPGRGFEALDAPALLGERAALFGFRRQGRIACGGSARLLAGGDGGWLALNLPRDDDWGLLSAWLETDLTACATTRDWGAVERALAGRACDPLVLRGREIGLAVARAVAAPVETAAPFRLEHESHTSGATSRPRVLDLSALWAGPLAGSLLAQAGCEVLKVESPHRPDGARLGEARFFDLLNADKHACALDLAVQSERALFLRMLESADVVLESARPRALAQLGIDARAWVDSRPGRIWASITGYGREHEWIAFGDDAAIAAGLGFDPGREISAPRFCADAIADPLTGLTAAVAILALHTRGRGGLLSLALAEVAADCARVLSSGPHDGGSTALTLPLEFREGAWQVHDGARWMPVAAPRARTPRRRAPPLAPPDAGRIADWTRAC